MSSIDRLSINEEFSHTPGPRYRREGPFSAEEFWATLLRSRFETAVAGGAVLLIDMDGVAGYGTSFVEETFGGLARAYGTETVRRHLQVKCEQDDFILEEVWEYVDNPQPPKRK
jgi:STAS-like domain of unknown function (DUF4325)